MSPLPASAKDSEVQTRLQAPKIVDPRFPLLVSQLELRYLPVPFTIFRHAHY